MNELEVFKALSNQTRLQILRWLRDPDKHFTPQGHSFTEVGVAWGKSSKNAG